MPSIPPNLVNGSHYLAQGVETVQSLFNVSLPLIDTPGFLDHTAQFVKEHPEQVKVAGIAILAVVAGVIVLCVALPLLVALFTTILGGLATVINTVIFCILFVLKTILQLLLWVPYSILHVLGFTARGIAAGSVAAASQSAFYGAFTTGLFSVLQSLGMIIGRLAGAAAVVVV